ncbi:hypothetical protein [Burkholderia cepacia]|uniref:hypothetical protein n=1 Tax=Burkholderia cepacia TaxID=292 RepID=UPI00075D7C4F|nr:hypothetical protein [Burkholderia cepacia]KWF86444.1 hypothetical protein WL95_36995 [Burkholderia cepacia]
MRELTIRELDLVSGATWAGDIAGFGIGGVIPLPLGGGTFHLAPGTPPLITIIIENPGIGMNDLKCRHPELDGNQIAKLITDLCHQDIIEIAHS